MSFASTSSCELLVAICVVLITLTKAGSTIRIYFVFYRNLFARLRDPTQYVVLQILTSSWIVIWYPLAMSPPIWRLLGFFGYGKDYEEHLDSVSQSLYLRNLAENVTMASFLGAPTLSRYRLLVRQLMSHVVVAQAGSRSCILVRIETYIRSVVRSRVQRLSAS